MLLKPRLAQCENWLTGLSGRMRRMINTWSALAVLSLLVSVASVAVDFYPRIIPACAVSAGIGAFFAALVEWDGGTMSWQLTVFVVLGLGGGFLFAVLWIGPEGPDTEGRRSTGKKEA